MQSLQKQGLERNQLLQQLNQPDTVNQDESITQEKFLMIPSASKKVPPGRDARFDFSFPTPFVFQVITERQKGTVYTEAINFIKSLKKSSQISLPVRIHQNDLFSFRERHDSYLYYNLSEN